MAVRIRLSRIGRIHRPFYRVVAIESRCHREGTASEILGTYDPLLKDKNLAVSSERIDAWVQQGALISEAVTSLLKRHGYPVPSAGGKARTKAGKAEAKADGKKWVAPTRRAKKNHEVKLKAARKAAAAVAKPAEAVAADAPQA